MIHGYPENVKGAAERSGSRDCPYRARSQFQKQGLRRAEGSHPQDGHLYNPEPVMLDERALSEHLGVSRTPIREAIAMLEQDGFVKTVPRRGIVVVRKTKAEIVDMIRAWAALEHGCAAHHHDRAQERYLGAAQFL
jgi:hypothetical protein